MVDGLARGLVVAHGLGLPQLGEPVAVRAQLLDQAPQPLVRRIPARGRAQVGDDGGLELASGLGVWRTWVPGPTRLRHTALRSLPRHPDGSPIRAAYSGLASSRFHAASKTATGVPVSRSSIRCTPG